MLASPPPSAGRGGPGGRPLMGCMSLRWEATAEPPAGEHSEASEPWSSWGRPCPGRCRGGRTAGGMPCQMSTAIRAPQILLQLTDSTSEPRRTGMLFLGIDWGEHHHHDLCLLDQDGMMLAARRITDGLAGVGELHALVAAHAQGPAEVVVGIETDRGLLVGALLAAGYQMYAVNPHTVSRYRGRHGSSRPSPTAGTPWC